MTQLSYSEVDIVRKGVATAYAQDGATPNQVLAVNSAGELVFVDQGEGGGGGAWPTFYQTAVPEDAGDGDIWVRPSGEDDHYPDFFGVGAFRYNNGASQWQQIAPVALNDSGAVVGQITVGPDGASLMEAFSTNEDGSRNGQSMTVAAYQSGGGLFLSGRAFVQLGSEGIRYATVGTGFPSHTFDGSDDANDIMQVKKANNSVIAAFSASGLTLAADGTLLIADGTHTLSLLSQGFELSSADGEDYVIAAGAAFQSTPAAGHAAFSAFPAAGGTVAFDAGAMLVKALHDPVDAQDAATKAYVLSQVAGGFFSSGSGTPVGSVTPAQVGALYSDTSNGALYIAVDVTSADWVAVGGSGGGGNQTGVTASETLIKLISNGVFSNAPIQIHPTNPSFGNYLSMQPPADADDVNLFVINGPGGQTLWYMDSTGQSLFTPDADGDTGTFTVQLVDGTSFVINPTGPSITLQLAGVGPVIQADNVGMDVASGLTLGFFGATRHGQAAFVPDPSGGGTVDTQARSAIVAINTILKNIGLEAAA